MGHWSILSSMDRMEGHTYVVPLPLDEAVYAVGYALQAPGRVITEQLPDGRYAVRTVKHTPGWAFLIPVLLFFVRRTKVAELVFTPLDSGRTGVSVYGPIDTAAAMRLREMTTVLPAAR